MTAPAGGPPDNAAWFHIAYAVAAVAYVAYGVSIWWRQRQWPRRQG